MSSDAPRGSRQHKKRWLLLIVALILVVPFALRHASPALEIYPAILFPVGAGRTDMTKEWRPMHTYILKAALSDGQVVELDPIKFLGPAAGPNRARVLASYFGTKPVPKPAIMGRIPLPSRPAADPNDIAELHAWLQDRSMALGIGTLHALYIELHEREVSILTGAAGDHRILSLDTLVVVH